MKVIRGRSTNPAQPLTSPFPAAGTRFFFELRGGDILHPWGDGDWFKPPYFDRLWRTFCARPWLPFMSWRWPDWMPFLKGKGGYVGFKAYGADHDEYLHWMPHADVYDGSQALQMSIRPFATLNK